ncbi:MULTISPECIES: AlpA family transcriptional regulator [unclassified Brucella]|uniref:helix-turn-helix transcriptional regulator n=1 Tax=unclassified Brucella TaxID=2632610 RepID=UPI0019335244|nr:MULTISPECIES: AlpA family phage regulatory protein [unclassified Brucella]
MNTITQLSLLNTDKRHADGLIQAQPAPVEGHPSPDRVSDIVPLPDTPFTYGDVKGRARVPQPIQPAQTVKPRTDNEQAAVPAGYDAPSTEDEKYLSVRAVARRYGISVATIWRWSKEDQSFPKPCILRQGTTRWRLSQLLAFENHSKGC